MWLLIGLCLTAVFHCACKGTRRYLKDWIWKSLKPFIQKRLFFFSLADQRNYSWMLGNGALGFWASLSALYKGIIIVVPKRRASFLIYFCLPVGMRLTLAAIHYPDSSASRLLMPEVLPKKHYCMDTRNGSTSGEIFFPHFPISFLRWPYWWQWWKLVQRLPPHLLAGGNRKDLILLERRTLLSNSEGHHSTAAR